MAKSVSSEKDDAGGGCSPEVWLKHHRAITLSARELGQKQSEHQLNFKKAKSDGVNIDAERALLRRMKLDADAVATNDRDLERYERWAGRRKQSSLFDDAIEEAAERVLMDAAEIEAETEGYDAGIAGRVATDHRFDPGSAEAAAFARGHAAAGVFLRRTGQTAKKSQETTPKPRTRKMAAAGDGDNVTDLPAAREAKARAKAPAKKKTRAPAKKEAAATPPPGVDVTEPALH